jgi:hypothetical protein
MDDVNRIATALERETTQKDPKDEISMKMWLDDLGQEGANSFCKDKEDPPPPGSRLAADVLILVLQTQFQSDVFRRLGGGFLGIDATHNTTCYTAVSLTTIMARDEWGRGKRILIYLFGQVYRVPSISRSTSRLDAVIQYTSGHNYLLPQISPILESFCLARLFHDRS